MPTTCVKCGLRPDQIEEYIEAAAVAGMSPDDYVLHEEGTLNPENGSFACTQCYIDMGSPTSPRGWVAP